MYNGDSRLDIDQPFASRGELATYVRASNLSRGFVCKVTRSSKGRFEYTSPFFGCRCCCCLRDPSSLLCCLIRVRCKMDGCPGIVSAYPQAGALGAFKISRATTPHTCMSNNYAVRVPAAQAKELLAPVRDLMGDAKASAIVKHIRTVHGGQLGIRTVPAELRSLLISACRPYHRWRRRSE